MGVGQYSWEPLPASRLASLLPLVCDVRIQECRNHGPVYLPLQRRAPQLVTGKKSNFALGLLLVANCTWQFKLPGFAHPLLHFVLADNPVSQSSHVAYQDHT